MFNRVGLSIAIALLAAQAASAGGPGGQPVLLRMRFRAGTVTRYRLTMENETTVPITMEPGAAARPVSHKNRFTSTVRQTVLSVFPNGNALVRIEYSDAAKQQMMQGRRGGPPQPETVTYDTLGRAVDTSGSSPADADPSSSGFGHLIGSGPIGMGVYLPAKPVRVGESWTTQIAVPQSTQRTTVTSTLMGFGSVNGIRTAQIRSLFRVPLNSTMEPSRSAGSITMSGAGSFDDITDVAMSDGRVAQVVLTGDVTVRGAVSGGESPLRAMFPHGIDLRSHVAIRADKIP